MRRLLVAAASGAVLLLGTGCSATPAGDAVPTASTGPGAAVPGASAAGASGAPAVPGVDPSAAPGRSVTTPGDLALGANTDAICKQAVTFTGQMTGNFLQAIKKLADVTKRGDKAAVSRTEAEIRFAIDGWTFALKDLADLTDDAGLEKALNAVSADVADLKKDLKKVNKPRLDELRGRVVRACAGT